MKLSLRIPQSAMKYRIGNALTACGKSICFLDRSKKILVEETFYLQG